MPLQVSVVLNWRCATKCRRRSAASWSVVSAVSLALIPARLIGTSRGRQLLKIRKHLKSQIDLKHSKPLQAAPRNGIPDVDASGEVDYHLDSAPAFNYSENKL